MIRGRAFLDPSPFGAITVNLARFGNLLMGRKFADSLEAGNASVTILPNQMITIEVAVDKRGAHAQYTEVQHTIFIPGQTGGRTHAVRLVTDGKVGKAIYICSQFTSGAVRAVVVNNALCRDDCTCATLLDALHVSHMYALYALPKSPDVYNTFSEGLRALCQDR